MLVWQKEQRETAGGQLQKPIHVQCVDPEYRQKLQPLSPSSFNTVTMVTASKAENVHMFMCNGTSATRVNHTGTTYCKWCSISQEALKKSGVGRSTFSLHWDGFQITFIFTQLIYRHLQLVQTGNVSTRKAETWLQNKPRVQFYIGCAAHKQLHDNKNAQKIQLESYSYMTWQACSRMSLLLYHCTCSITLSLFTLTTGSNINALEARGFI